MLAVKETLYYGNITLAVSYLNPIHVNCVTPGGKLQEREEKIKLDCRETVGRHWKESRAQSVGARPPAFPPAAVSAPFRALGSQAAPPRRSSATIGSFERLRLT